ncbi:MAG: FAD-dependent oxidoreductase [Caulobacteraceae bacterium]
MRLAVVGGGVFGLTIGLEALWRGAEVTLYDPKGPDNASAIAAGMLAPAFEAALDPVSISHFPLLRRSRDLWPALLAKLGQEAALDRSGALFVVDENKLDHAERAATGLMAAGAAMEWLSPTQARRRAPSLGVSPAAAIFSEEDWRLQPRDLLAAMRGALLAGGGRWRRERVGAEPEADAVVIAAGADAGAMAGWAPELRHLSPIKGQILHLAAPPTSGPSLRSPEGYIAPQSTGVVVGATMEAGRHDRRTSPAALQRLRRGAGQWIPALLDAPGKGWAGVRAATPDGLPLAGASVKQGVFLAVGARRNGWLLAPLVAEVLVSRLIDGRDMACAFDPRRFEP